MCLLLRKLFLYGVTRTMYFQRILPINWIGMKSLFPLFDIFWNSVLISKYLPLDWLYSFGQTVHRLIILFHATSHLGKKSRLEIVKDAGHVCQFENPDSVNYLIENFLLESNWWYSFSIFTSLNFYGSEMPTVDYFNYGTICVAALQVHT